MSITRDKLYEEVWAEPMTAVAVRYQVSSNYLARVCQHLNVPYPHCTGAVLAEGFRKTEIQVK